METDKLVIYSGQRHTTMKSADQEYYIGERGRRGNMLARGYRNVIRIEAELFGQPGENEYHRLQRK
ncbi:MAG: hypothetical protein O7D86_00455 [Proteobacteria bacterium]|nr:hypothetical protein [Pseudomonadota bacterium]